MLVHLGDITTALFVSSSLYFLGYTVQNMVIYYTWTLFCNYSYKSLLIVHFVVTTILILFVNKEYAIFCRDFITALERE
jgi:hypothetical protein